MQHFKRLLFLISLVCFIQVSIADPTLDLKAASFDELEQSEIFEKKAMAAAKVGDADGVVENLEFYIKSTGDFTLIENSAFETVNRTEAFKQLKDKYLLKFRMSTFFYLYVGLIGFFIALVLNVRKRTDNTANALISAFVFMHSFFLIHISLYLTNYTYSAPHTLSMSTIFSFLYGPILYFYFKRITENYSFKRSDLLHLLPTVGLIIIFMPIYSLSAEEKLMIMLGAGEYESHPYLQPVTIIKLVSLFIYGYLTLQLYRKNTKKVAGKYPQKVRLQRTIMGMQGVYAGSYAVYAFLIFNFTFTGILFHGQLITMTAIVLYIGYIAYANPKVLVGIQNIAKKVVGKYQNSGLTPSFSVELKVALESLMLTEKLYRQNSLKLEDVAERLGTTRHNTSQVINEHFGLNFFELVNKYRVEEAMELLKDNTGNRNIIDVAYEVGYNNKVTFNKSFKRFAQLTPSQFMKLQAAG
ncbi:MAG: AraC-like DNA-binding protein [Flavobacteriales bacterium]|jgi:AraC-like DNA-binding protein